MAMTDDNPLDLAFLAQHLRASRRYFMRLGIAGAAAASQLPAIADESDDDAPLRDAINSLETWLTSQDDFRDVSRGKPKPHSISEAKRKEVGLTRETWKLEIVSDPEHPARIGNPMTSEAGTALSFESLMELAKTKSVRFAKIMTCLNIGCPLGMGIWEGVPLRDVLWMADPKENLRRVFYYGYHNDDEAQMFRSSLPVGRVLEDPFDLPPVILCYKLNGQWLSPKRGGPVRVVVPEAYGFKSIKWLTRMVLSNLPHANDTYAEKNNDVDSHLKTYCATISLNAKPTANAAIPITGWAQVGISGLKKVQVWIHPRDTDLPDDDPNFLKAPWQDADILPVPKEWGGDLPENRIPKSTIGFSDETSKPNRWPLNLAKAHWAYLHPGLPSGEYIVRCRTIDENGAAQPMPRPFRKSGHAAIEQKRIVVN